MLIWRVFGERLVRIGLFARVAKVFENDGTSRFSNDRRATLAAEGGVGP